MSHSSNFTLPDDAPGFIVTRVFDAPRALLWTCWMEPSHLSRWWGPEGFTCPVCEVDPQAGGRFRLVIRSPEGADYAMSGIFREIVPHEKIVKEDDVSEHSEEWHDMIDPARKGQGKRKIEMLTTVTFEDHGKGARLTMRTRFPSIALRDNFAGMGAKQVWISSLERLDDLSNALKDSDREFNIVRVVSAPVAKVFAAFSDPEGMAKWWGPNGFTTTTHHMNFRMRSWPCNTEHFGRTI